MREREMVREMVNVKRPDGTTCPAYLAMPPGAEARPAVVVIQEWWGLNEQIKKVAHRLADEGYRALVADLYRGKVAVDGDEASHMMGSLDFLAATDQDVRACVTHLKERHQSKVAVMGFCMGGALTLLAAMRVPEMDAGVCFYGIPPREAGDPSGIRLPLCLHFAETDEWCTPKAVAALEDQLKRSRASFELWRYDAKHAFMNEKRPEVYHDPSATLAWQRTREFLKKHVG